MRSRSFLLLCCTAVGLGRATPAYGQIVPDGTTSTRVFNNRVVVPTNANSVRGGNLFHSFQEFNVGTSGVGFGAGGAGIDPSRIRNIITRVTGGKPSQVLGIIDTKSSFPTANFYLMNPSGIVFGNGAALNVGGSFYATTGTSIGFSSGELFNADPRIPSFPTSDPINVQFAVDRPAAIINTANLEVARGATLGLVGGSIISTGRLSAPEGSVDVAAAAGNRNVVLRSPGLTLGLEIREGTVGQRWTGTIAELPQLARLLTGGTPAEAGKVVVDANGRLQLVPENASTELSTFLRANGQFDTVGRVAVGSGDAILKAVAAGDLQILASRNINLLAPDLAASRSAFARAGESLVIRDTMQAPARLTAGTSLTFWGDRGIDILALNHPKSPISSTGFMGFVSNGRILADGYFSGESGIFAATPGGTRVPFFSAIEFVRRGATEIRFLPEDERTQQPVERLQAYRSLLKLDELPPGTIDGGNPPGNAIDIPSADGSNGGTDGVGVPGGTKGINGTESLRASIITGGTEVDFDAAAQLAVKTGLAALGELPGQTPLTQGSASLTNAADLLLREGRILEAQQALDMALVREIEGYLGIKTAMAIAPADPDDLPAAQRPLYAEYRRLQAESVRVERQLADLKAIPEAGRSPDWEQRVTDLEAQWQQQRQAFAQFLARPEVAEMASAASRLMLRQLQANLRALDPHAVLLYPLIRDDRLELILIPPTGDPIRRTAQVRRDDLLAAIEAFRRALETVYDPALDARQAGQQLYQWLVAPIADDLQQMGAETIVYAPYAQLRYVPLAALHDGDRWLIERYRINHITAANVQDFRRKASGRSGMLAAAATRSMSFQVGDRAVRFAGLPFARREVETLAAIVPNSIQLIDSEFSPQQTFARLGDRALVHLATHAAFVSGKPEDSFIAFGNGERVSLADVRNWSLPDVELVVLSACDTAVSAILGTGEEILGFGYLMQQSGARAAIASLWSVDDGGTQALMDAFYTLLEQPGMTKAEALRQAQIAMIRGNFTNLGSGGERVAQRIRDRLPVTVTEYLDHPFYWAPFILIGNGL